jgi:wobble nucleotide-excising tRNase
MFDKFLEIQNVGKFISYKAGGKVNFQRLALVYGENGRGKTTLAAILRSLATNNPDFILERKTVGAAGMAMVRIKPANARPVTFKEGVGWDSPIPGFEIFDSTYVNDNIYSGNLVAHEHRKNLYYFVIGQQGVVLANTIDQLDAEIRALKAAIDEKEREIERKIEWIGDVEKFVNLPQVADLKQKLKAAEGEVSTLEQKTEIQKRSLLAKLNLGILALDQTKMILNQKLADLLSDAEKMVQQHINQHLDENGEAWLQTGMSYLQKDACPFCGQNLDGLEILSAYRSYFSASYSDLKQQIGTAGALIKEYFDQEKLLELQKIYQTNKALLEDWQAIVDLSKTNLVFDKFVETWNQVSTLLMELIAEKQSQPLEDIDHSKLQKAKAAHQKLTRMAIAYNTWVEEVNAKITEFKARVGAGNLEEARKRLKILQATEKRYTPGVDALCEEYKKIIADREQKQQDKKKAKKDLDTFVEGIFKTYQESINGYLEKFGVGFRICELAPSFAGGKTSTSYGLVLNDVTVKVCQSSSNCGPSFKSGASDGDKSALAFAFFLAKLDNDPDLANKIVVFDDPITSLDVNRKNCTKDEILRICGKAKQVIVLSHDPYFLRLVWDNSLDPANNAATLCVSRKGNDKESTITEWDIIEETKSDYHRDYFTLCEYLDNPSGDMRAVARTIRPVLEGYYRVRFPREFPPDKWLGDFINAIRQSSGNHPLVVLQNDLSEINAVNNFSKKYHHQDNSKADSEPIIDAELQTYIRRALKLISG